MSGLRAAVADRGGWPTVSVVVPVRNEGPNLERAVASILAQEYPVGFDICLAVAPSQDDTSQVAERLAAAERRVSVVANPTGRTPAGLNCAIAATRGEVVVRVDGHAELSPGYITRAVETMLRTGAVNVGGRQVPRPETMFEEAVAAATSCWLGTGGATYRLGGEEGPVDTVYLGVFDRAACDAVGWFDETLVRNQDYELNIRLRQAGGTIWFDPDLAVGYRPRSSPRTLARQYYEYGFWKAEVLRRHPRSMRLRQLVPAVFPFGLVAGAAIGLRHRLALSLPIGYVLLVLVTGYRASGPRARPVAVASSLGLTHLSWGVGFAAGALGIVRSRAAGRVVSTATPSST